VELAEKMAAEYRKVLTVKLTYEMFDWLSRIALYERVKKSELIRRWIGEKIHSYERNPRFLQFEKELRMYGKLRELGKY